MSHFPFFNKLTRCIATTLLLTTTRTAMAWTVHVSSKEHRAGDMVDALRSRGIVAQKTDLQVADVAFTRNDMTYVQAEIKKARDMVASITDCRYHEQSAAMAEVRVPFNFYLIMGYKPPDAFGAGDESKVQHALTRLQLSGPMNLGNVSHLGVVYLTSPESLIEWITYVHKNLVDDPERTTGVFAPLSSRVKHNFGTKPAHRGQARVYIEMLSRVTGIAEDKAKALTLHFPTMSLLLTWLREAASQEDIVTHLKGLKTGLADKAAESLYTQLLSPQEMRFTWTSPTSVGRKKRARASLQD